MAPCLLKRQKLIIALILAAVAMAPLPKAYAIGAGPGGQDLLHVPISWCPVIGSPRAGQSEPRR